MKIIIAEKPSVARDIAAVVGATQKKEGYIEGGGYAVTWAFGHLVGLAMPEHYGITGFQRENLPILPTEFKLLPRQVKEGKEYKNDPGVIKQLNVIRELFRRGDSIIAATDAGREGELIFRYIFDYLGCTLSFERLWISSLTDRAIKDGFKTLRPGSDYDNLYASANIFEVIEAIDDMDDDKKEAFEVWLNHESYDISSRDINDLISSFEDDFQGAYKDEEDYAYEIVDECYDLPEFAKTYFDYEKFARDLFMTDYWFDDGYVFRHS